MSTTEINSRLDEARQIYEATSQSLSEMKEGDRIQLKDLAKNVALSLSLDSKEVLGFVSHFVRKTTVAYITRGKNGGVVKGTKPVKVVKPAKKVDATATVSS